MSSSASNTSGLKLTLIAAAIASFSATAYAAPTLESAAEALGASQLKSIEFKGTGHWFQFGQAPNPSSSWPQFDVSDYVATVNFEAPAERVQITRKQVVEAKRARPAPVEQKPDQYVNGNTAWNLAPAPGAAPDSAPVPQAQPAAVEERLSEIWATPQGFLKAAEANHAVSKKVKAGLEVSFTADKHRYVGIINAKNQVTNVKTWIDNPVLGDTLLEYSYADYKDFNGISFPTTIIRKQGGHPVLALGINSVTPNVEANFSIPAEVASTNAPVTVTADQLTPGVYYLKGGTHHSVAIEQANSVVVVEAPLNEARSEAVIAKVKEIIPNKPITYLVNTHQHFDHAGGLRTYVDEGATIVTSKINQSYYQKIWANPHTINPDRLALSKKTAKFKTFSDKLVLPDATHPVEIHQIAGSGHDDGFALVYLPKDKVLVEADAYTPTAANAPLPATPNPYSVNLYDNVKRLKLDVEQIAALHGPRVTKLDDLEAAIGVKRSASN